MNGKNVAMELDTGAAVSVMSASCYDRVSARKLEDSNLRLKTYTGEVVRPLGVGLLDVVYGDQRCELPVTVVKGNVPTLMGRDWLSQLKLKWHELFPSLRNVNSFGDDIPELQEDVKKLISQYPEVFTEKLGRFKDFKVNIPVPHNAQPRFFKARPVPYALKARLDAELDKLEEQGVWTKVNYSRWAAPIVPVLKDARDSSSPIRIC